MKQITLSFKDGYVTMGHNFNGEVEIEKLDQDELLFEVGDKTSGPANVIYTVSRLLAAHAEELKEDKKSRMIIALPKTIYEFVTNIDMLIQINWSGKMIYKFVTPKDSKKAVATWEKVNERRKLSKQEAEMYKNLLNNIRRTLGSVAFMDSYYTPLEHKEKEDAIQAAWCDINQAMKETRTSKKAPKVYGTNNREEEGYQAEFDEDDMPY